MANKPLRVRPQSGQYCIAFCRPPFRTHYSRSNAERISVVSQRILIAPSRRRRRIHYAHDLAVARNCLKRPNPGCERTTIRTQYVDAAHCGIIRICARNDATSSFRAFRNQRPIYAMRYSLIRRSYLARPFCHRVAVRVCVGASANARTRLIC